MIRTLRAFFLSRLLREKLLLVGFLGVAVVMWASAFSSRAARFWRAQHNTTVALADQEKWLARRAEIDAAAQKAAGRFDPAKTLDQTRLFATVKQLAADAGLRNVNSLGSSASPVTNGQFSINSQRFQIPNADWPAFTKFYLQLQARSPYMGIRELALQPARGNAAQITASLTISSFEVRH